jgi:FixJ family two-component response regulator
MSGGELAGKLETLRSETKILFVSGYAGQTVLDHKVVDVDANFLQKPFTLKQLAGKIRSVLDRVGKAAPVNSMDDSYNKVPVTPELAFRD